MSVLCARCFHEILPGQLYRRHDCSWGINQIAHLACPTAREVEIAARWGRWR